MKEIDKISRPYWISRIENTWKTHPIAWLTGVRRVGKTTLAKAIPNATYLNCDLPSVQEELKDPETFFKNLSTPIVIFDEIHQLRDPSQTLKIGADQFGGSIRILATGSSTLGASSKFRDTLTGRKRSIHLVPVMPEECAAFGVRDIRDRMLKGGLPGALLATEPDPEFFLEWLDSFYSRDVQEIFHVEKRQPFIQLLEVLLRQNAGLAEILDLAKISGVSRPTVVRYLEILEATQAITVLRPYRGGGGQELIAQPKIYGFDTGFVAFARGWTSLRPDDCGHLLENLVLESLLSIPALRSIHYWRTKQKQEIDFVIPVRHGWVDAIECKWNGNRFDSSALKRFRTDYPGGRNYLVCSNPHLVQQKAWGTLKVIPIAVPDLRKAFARECD